MPKVKTSRVKYPEGWELIEPTLRELQAKMREGWNFICYIIHALLDFILLFLNLFVLNSMGVMFL